ncbi:hypothetical protein OMAG_000481 [Candidatus Omnitrophus magneticus]|uniref:Uncharacterized protein n=1 Tax=Candidatus Omnitrophus magneticus TaxID=1609969 RepID=A0A0F0CVR4_9BACT|nr:hypothetical protein OMAG_000481 [Candidatus Omnitrophus magneticus]
MSSALSFLRKQESIQVTEDYRKKIFWNLKLKINFRGWDVHGFRIFFFEKLRNDRMGRGKRRIF